MSENQSKIRFVLDSGAFTAWKSGQSIELYEYCNFIKSLPFKPWRYFALDVIGNPHATMQNYKNMLKENLNPIPVFTRGEDPRVLNEYYKTSDVVGIGGLVGTEGNKGFVKGIMKMAAGRKVHLLGFTSLPFLKALRPYMADSSSWLSSLRYAQSPLYLGQGAPVIMLKKSTIRKQVLDSKIRNAIRQLRLEPEDLLNPANWNGGTSISGKLAARSMVRLSYDVEKNLGTHLFLAAATKPAVEMLLEAVV